MPTLNWLGKDKVQNYSPPLHFLNKISKGSAPNKIIHGDNLLALKALLPRYQNKIHCIYIDPPYNTGNEGWIYNDNLNSPQLQKWLGSVVGSDDLTRHDKWLCMMFPRLQLLRKLLAPNGSIFISIDDNEQAFLKCICDEIFGASNFVAQIVWQKRFSRSNDAKYFCDNHDYIICYAKDKSLWRPNLLPRTDEIPKGYKNPDNDPRGVWTSTSLSAKSGSESSIYEITSPNGKKFLPPKGRYWGCSPETFQKWLEDNRIWFGADGNGVPRRKTFLSEVQQGLVPFTVWLRDEVGDTQESKREVKGLGINFETPKPTRLIERILQLATDKDSLVLDSFAGSGTTAHAVIKQNAADGGSRRYILIEQESYAKEITAERVKRIGGEYEYYEVGAPLLDEDGFINAELELEKLYEYIWQSETGKDYEPSGEENLIGESEGTAYYYFDALNWTSLSKVQRRAQSYVIYAESCNLSEAELLRYGITFKQVPFALCQ